MALLLATRLALLALLYFVTGGREISNDVALHMDMVRTPFFMLTGNDFPDLFPPLLPLLEAWLAYPLQKLVTDFLALRFTFIFYELALGFLFYRAIQILDFAKTRVWKCLWAFLLLPMGWMTSTIMAQDEVIAACFVLLPTMAMMAGWPLTALAIAGIGVVAGKIFLVLVLLVLLAISQAPSLRARLAAGFGPIFLVYVPVSFVRWLHDQPQPLLGLRPDPYFGTNFWILLKAHFGLNLEAAGAYSGLIAFAAALIPVWLVWKSRRISQPPIVLVMAVSCTLMLFLALFYNVLAEYFVMVFPLMILTAVTRWHAIACAAVAALPWAIRFFQNAASLMMADTSPGKLVVLQYYKMIFHSAPGPWLEGSEALFSVVMLAVAVLWTIRLKKMRALT